MSIQTPTGQTRDYRCKICGGPNVRPVETVWNHCTRCIGVLSWLLAGVNPLETGSTAEECAVVQRYLDR